MSNLKEKYLTNPQTASEKTSAQRPAILNKGTGERGYAPLGRDIWQCVEGFRLSQLERFY